MDIDEKLKLGIGTKETKKLTPGNVEVVAIDVSPPKDKEGNIIKGKGGKELSDKVTLSCKHPDSEELIEISKVKYLKVDKLKESGLWFQLDEDGKIPKNSALAELLRHYNISSLSEIVTKKLVTVADEEGYLCTKAY